MARSRLLLALLVSACGGGEELILPGDGEPATIAVLEGDGQRGRVGEPLSDPLVVQVTDSRGRPVEDAPVAFEFEGGGPGAAVVPQTTSTNSDGIADAQVVLGTSVGQQSGMVRVVTAEGRTPVEAPFVATALPEDANRMAAVAGEDQTGHVNQPLDDRLVVEVTDGFGNPVAGVPITWVAEGGGSVSEALVNTDEDGRARVDRTLGPAVGQQTTIATSEGLAGSPVTFVHTALAGDASRLVVVSGQDQTGAAGALLPAELVVRLVDAEGNGVPATAISWVVATGGGSASPTTTTTDGEGRATTQWTLGTVLGPQRIDAVASGVGFISFHATATAGAPATLFIRTQPPATARNGLRFDRQPVIQVRDSRGNDVATAGVPISVEIQSGGGELSGTRVRNTDASGRATFDDLAISGTPGKRTLIFTAEGYSSVTSAEIDLSAIGTTTTITGDSPDPSAVNTAFTVSFRVTSEGPTPTGNVTVTDGVQSCSGALVDGAGGCSLTLSTTGQRTLTATYAGGPGLTGSSDTEGHLVAAAPPPQPAATATTITADTPDPSVSGSTFTVSFQVSSSGGTPTGRVTVTVSGGTPTCSAELSGGSGSCELTLNTVGSRTLTATYSGASGFAPSADTEPHRVDAREPPPPAETVTTITNDTPDPSIAGTSFTVRFQVTSSGGTPTGTVTVRASGGSPTCTGTLSGGQGSCDLTLNNPGDRTLTATYSGGSGFNGSSDTEPHTVAPPTPQNEEPFADFNWHCEGRTCSFTDASRDSDGSIASRSWNFGDGSPASNELNPTHTYATGGEYTVVLTVTDNGGLTDESSDEVDPEDESLRISTQPSSSASQGEPFDRQPEIELRAGGDDLERAGVVITATLASGSGSLGGNTTATTDANGRAEFTNLSISSGAGPHTIRFTASGFEAAVSATINVDKASSTTTITSDNDDPSEPGEPVNVQYQVVSSGGTPNGTVRVTASGGDESCEASVAAGGCSITLLSPGSRTLRATYSGDDLRSSSFDEEPHTVTSPPPPPPPNQAPDAEDDAFTTTQDVSISREAPGVLANDIDPEGTPLSAALVTGPTNGTAVVSDNGAFTYQPSAGYTGSDQFTYRASDGTLSTEATVFITVDPTSVAGVARR